MGSEEKDGDAVVLTDDDMTATIDGAAAVASVRSTVFHTSGRRYFEFDALQIGPSDFGGVSGWRFGFITDLTPPGYNFLLGSLDFLSLGYPDDGGWITNGLGAGSGSEGVSIAAGARYGVAVDLDNLMFWVTNDGVTWSGGAGDPAAGTGGSIGLQFITGATQFWIGFSGHDDGDAIRLYTDIELFLYTPPGELGNRNWGDVFVAMGAECNLDPDHIVTVDITKDSEGGVIYDGLTWTDFVTQSGRGTNIDWWEDGQDIYIKQIALDDPVTDVASIPQNHRYIKNNDRGSSEAQRGAEGRKPSVVEVSAYEVTRQFQHSMIPTRSEAHQSVSVEKVILPWVMTAAAIADFGSIVLGKLEAEVEPHDLSLPPMVPYIRMRPADIIEYNEEGKTQKTKVHRWQFASDFEIEVTLRKLFTTTTLEPMPIVLPVIEANEPQYSPTIPASTGTPIGLLLALTYETPP